MVRKSAQATPVALPPQPGEGHLYRVEAVLEAEARAYKSSTISSLTTKLFEAAKEHLVELGFEAGSKRKTQGGDGEKSIFEISVELFAFFPEHVTEAKEAKRVWHRVASSVPFPEDSWQVKIGRVDSSKMLAPGLDPADARAFKRHRRIRTPKRARR